MEELEYTKRELTKYYSTVNNFEEADEFVLKVRNGQLNNVLFATYSLKTYCFSKILQYCDANIINCNSCIERFCEDLNKESKISIFDNINYCKDINILNIVRNRKGILVC